MGSSASKPSRKLASTIQKDATSTILANRKGNINTLPSEELKHRYIQHSQEVNQPPPVSDIQDTHLPLNSSFRTSDPTKFDSSKLSKKINARAQASPPPPSQVPQAPQTPNSSVPEGKDGFDPQVGDHGSYSNAFTDSVMKLGSQIQSHSMDQKLNQEFTALKQLRNRKTLYLKGEKENEDELNGVSDAQPRTMIHPRSLGGILNDLRDPRITNERILLDYKLHPDFLKELGTRFKLATDVLVVKEEAKEGEILVQNTAPSESQSLSPPAPPPSSAAAAAASASQLADNPVQSNMIKQDYNEDGELTEVNPERLQQLKNRLGLDDEVEDESANARRR